MSIPQVKLPIIGGIKNVAGRTMFYVSILNFIMMLATSYTIVIDKYFGWISFTLYAGSVSFLVVCAFMFDYVVMMPSEVSFVNYQTYKHQNPIRTDLNEIKKDISNLKELIINENTG